MSFHEAKKDQPRKDMSSGRTSSKYCPNCKMHVRGQNHENGTHHKQRVGVK
jgi:hypothetical protein